MYMEVVNFYLSAGLSEAQPCMPVLFALSGQKLVFRTAGATHCPDKCEHEIWQEERTEGPLPRAKFHVYRSKNVGIQPPKLSKFRILAINLPLRDDSFALFSRNSQHLYASIGSF